jgi:hypothetical protein
MPCQSHISGLDHFKYTWQSAQAMKLFIMQFSLISWLSFFGFSLVRKQLLNIELHENAFSCSLLDAEK